MRRLFYAARIVRQCLKRILVNFAKMRNVRKKKRASVSYGITITNKKVVKKGVLAWIKCKNAFIFNRNTF